MSVYLRLTATKKHVLQVAPALLFERTLLEKQFQHSKPHISSDFSISHGTQAETISGFQCLQEHNTATKVQHQ